MNSSPGIDPLLAVQTEIQNFIRRLSRPLLWSDEFGTLDLSQSEWRLSLEYGKLIFEVWNTARSLRWRVDGIFFRSLCRLGVMARKPGGREAAPLEIFGADTALASSTEDFRQQVEAAVRREHPGWIFSRFTCRTDRAHSFSSWYVRAYARRGRAAWAWLALGGPPHAPAADQALAHGLNWLAWLREKHAGLVFSGLKIILPPSAIPLTAHRALFINASLVRLSILEWRSPAEALREVDLKDFGNVRTHLVPRLPVESLLAQHRRFLEDSLGEAARPLELFPGASSHSTSIRYLGLTLGRMEGCAAPRIYFGLDGAIEEVTDHTRNDFRQFILQAMALRSARSRDFSSPACALHPERWLESLLVRDVGRIDPALLPQPVYPQVPAFTG
jgi:hypothetical protein